MDHIDPELEAHVSDAGFLKKGIYYFINFLLLYFVIRADDSNLQENLHE